MDGNIELSDEFMNFITSDGTVDSIGQGERLVWWYETIFNISAGEITAETFLSWHIFLIHSSGLFDDQLLGQSLSQDDSQLMDGSGGKGMMMMMMMMIMMINNNSNRESG